ncbi:unnamed protein product [Trichobilharzia szidati]|nr:unnamed protein product [Trichobilharzia szidati]
MSQHKGLSTPQNKFLETIAARSDAIHANFVLGNAQRKYYPIVYCSDGFLLLTHYSRASVMSRSSVCQFLWGPETTPTVRMEINQAFHNHFEYRNRVVFYTRIGEPFACDFTMTPIRNEKSQVVLFLCCYQEICGNLLPPPMHQSLSCFKVNHSKLYSVLSWASELPFSRSYLQMKAENYAGNVDNDGNSSKRPDSKIDLITTQTTGNSSNSCCSAVENSQLLTLPAYTSQQKTDKHYLDIPTHFNRNTFNSHYNSHELIRQSQLSVNKSSFNSPEEIQLTGKAHYPIEYYLPSNCQTTQSLDVLSNPMCIKSSQQISLTQNKCIYRNASILSLPQIKLHLGKFSQKKAQIKANNKNDDEKVHEISSNVKSTENMISSPNDSSNKRTTSKCNHISNDAINVTPAENNAKNGIWKNANTVPSPDENNPSNFDQPCKEQYQQNEPVFTSETKSAFVTNTNNKTDQLVSDSSDNNQHTSFNCLTCFSGSLSDSQSNIGGSTSPGSNEPDPQKYSYKRRKSYAVIHGLTSGGWKTKDSNSGKLNRQIKNFSGKNVPEYKIQKLTKSNFVLLHYGLFRIVWDWLLLLLTFYIAFIVPYNVTFESHSTHSSRCSIIDLIVEIFLIIDVILNFHTTYVSKSGQIINDRKLIAKHYAKGWLILDLLAALPVDFILIFIQSSSLINLEDVYINSRMKQIDNSTIISNYTQEIISSFDGNKYYDSKAFMKFNLISLLQMMKLARLLRLARLIQKITRLSQYSVIVLGLLMFSFALVAHWCACIWYVIGLSEVDGSDIGWLKDLARRLKTPFGLNRSGGPSEGSKYFTALYFTCSSLTSVGFGNVSANTTNEKIFAICIMLLGALMHAAVFGNVTAIIQRMYARRTTFQSKVQDLKEFIEVHRIPKSLKNRMEDFFQTTWAINRGIDVPDVLKIYPEELQGDIYLHLNREVLGLKVFEKADRDCLKRLAVNFKLTFCTPGEYLIHTGDILRRLYFVSNGSLEVLEKDEVVALLGKNDWFGAFIDSDSTLNNASSMSTTSTFPVIRSRCDVKSLTYCDLHYIDLITLSEILNQHPRFKAELKSYLYEDLSFNIQEGAENFYSSDVITVPAITLQLANDDDKDWDSEETKLNIIDEVESLKPPTFIFDSKGRSCSLTSYDEESGLLNIHSNSQSNSELTTNQLTITTRNEERPLGKSPSPVTGYSLSHYPRRLQSSDKISSRRKFFITKSSKSSGCSSNVDLAQKSVEHKVPSIGTQVVQAPSVSQNDTKSINDESFSKSEQNRRHTVPTVQAQNPPLKSSTTTNSAGVNSPSPQHRNSEDHNTVDTWLFSNQSSGTQSNDEYCFPYIRSTYSLSKNCTTSENNSNNNNVHDNNNSNINSLLPGQCLSIPNFSTGVRERLNVNLSNYSETTIPQLVINKPICESVQLPQFRLRNNSSNNIGITPTSNLCLYTTNTSPVNSIWSCTNECNQTFNNYNRYPSPNRSNLLGSSLHDINLISELRSLNNRLECIEVQFTKLFKLLESKQFL